MKSLNQLLTEWRLGRQNMEKLTNNMPRIIGNESVKVVKDNFKLQGYDGGFGVKKWVARADKTNASYDHRGKIYKGSVYNSSSPLLQQTRNLYNSVKFKALAKQVVIGVDLLLIPYAERMNEGGGGVPARQYMPTDGPNPKMLKRIKKKYESERDKALKDFKK